MDILIGNSVSYITTFIPSDLKTQIVKELSYFDDAIFFRTKRKYLAFKTLFNEEKNAFPTGLMRRLLKLLIDKKIPYRLIDERKVPQMGYLKLKQLSKEPSAYIDQVNATNSAINCPSGRGIIVLPTGVGKTRVMKDLVLQLGVRTLIVEPGLNLKNQVTEYFSDCFGSNLVGQFHKSKSNPPISICNLDSLADCPQSVLEQFDCVLFDEYHHEACETARVINETKLDHIYYKFAFTATNFRNSKNEQILLETVLANELYSMTPLEAIEKNYIVPIEYYSRHLADKIPTNLSSNPFVQPEELEAIWELKKQSMGYNEVYKNFIVNHDERNTGIIQKALELREQKIPTLILVKEVQHGLELASNIPDSVFVTGQNDKLLNFSLINDFNNGKYPIMIGTSVIGEGIDTKRAGAVLLGNGEKAESRIMQNLGRVVRKFEGKEKGLVFDFKDSGHETTLKHSNKRAKIVKKHFGVKGQDF